MFYLGQSFYDQQKYDEAMQYYDKVLAIDPNDVNPLNYKAQILDEMGKNEKVLSVIEKTDIDNPNNEYLQYTMSFLLANLEREDEAKTYYEKTLKINPNLAETLTVEKELDVFDIVMVNKIIINNDDNN